MSHSRFTEDFKADAIKQITERGHSIADVSMLSPIKFEAQQKLNPQGV